mmetsp:Transcript_45499/g.130436  ORF Transcript_45499/g.130436 Transcript_45499/m.130436 type:complete len:229 (-) Transcript_45499:23-709(-)
MPAKNDFLPVGVLGNLKARAHVKAARHGATGVRHLGLDVGASALAIRGLGRLLGLQRATLRERRAVVDEVALAGLPGIHQAAAVPLQGVLGPELALLNLATLLQLFVQSPHQQCLAAGGEADPAPLRARAFDELEGHAPGLKLNDAHEGVRGKPLRNFRRGLVHGLAHDDAAAAGAAHYLEDVARTHRLFHVEAGVEILLVHQHLLLDRLPRHGRSHSANFLLAETTD